MKPGDAVGRASRRSSFLDRPNAKFSEENGRALKKLSEREKPRLAGPSRLSALRVDELTWGARDGDMSRAHRAGSRNRKSRPCQRTSQVVHRVAMVAWEIWAAQANDSFHLSWRYVQGEQFSSEPQIDDAPVNLGKAFLNMPTLHPGSINTRGSLRRHRAFLVDVQTRINPMRRRSRGLLCEGLHGGTQQILSGTGQDGARFDDFDPRSRTGGSTACEFLIGEARQPSQVTPVGAGQIATIRVSQLLTDERRYGRFQRSAAEANPSLKMTRTRLQHHTRLMAIGSHERKNLGSGVIQVEENIAGVAMLGIGQKINIMTLKVACAKKAHHRTACQLTRIPNPFSWTRFSGEAMNHADEIEIIRHGRELAAHGVPGKKKSAIAHGHENATKASRAYNDFSANGNNPLKSVSQSRGAPQMLLCNRTDTGCVSSIDNITGRESGLTSFWRFTRENWANRPVRQSR